MNGIECTDVVTDAEIGFPTGQTRSTLKASK
jgi:hypothetical protein